MRAPFQPRAISRHYDRTCLVQFWARMLESARKGLILRESERMSFRHRVGNHQVVALGHGFVEASRFLCRPL